MVMVYGLWEVKERELEIRTVHILYGREIRLPSRLCYPKYKERI